MACKRNFILFKIKRNKVAKTQNCIEYMKSLLDRKLYLGVIFYVIIIIIISMIYKVIKLHK
ncbi:hypothetical protein JSCD4_33930 [Clostridioides difficile]|nr:hypothetical protein JSCD4_33930 [Clostridioides difficile]GMK98482.1 hypothetical protein JSCD11_28160 [Clostridioides difficile]GML05048.1 hypothetical protein JSCD13_21470 [Clostridioides difficile]GML13960.1 hypothetical protein JSCD16_03610 [Clostridioides difficile]